VYIRPRSSGRGGAAAVEGALVYPFVVLCVIGMIVGGTGIFRYQQVAALAREGSRWASVRGSQYAADTGNAAATADDVWTNAIKPNAVGLDTTQLSYSVTWSPDNTAPDSTVTVKVSYKWVPEVFIAGPITLSSTSKVYMTY
jgi:Flp pilus assembly protein TadG